MDIRLLIIAGFAALVGASGCASMSADECMTGDWHAIGFEDGARGYTADRLGERRKACAKHGVTPDFNAYRAGHKEGLRDFCQPSRGFDFGARGGNYSGVCAADQEVAFLDAYRSGYQLYNLRSRVDSATSQINAAKNELEDTHNRIRDTEAALISGETTAEERVLLVADLADLSKRKGELETQVDLLIEDRARHEEQLASYQATLADAGY